MEKSLQEQSLQACENLGKRNNPYIAFNYPSNDNWCFLCKIKARPSLSHQATFCLAAVKPPCPVRTLPPWKNFPDGFFSAAGKEASKTSPAKTTSCSHIKHTLGVPFRIARKVFVIHHFQIGDSLEQLAKEYSTTIEVMQRINFFSLGSALIDGIIILCPGLTKVDPALPAFEPYHVADAGINVVDLANRLMADPILLKYYNGYETTDSCHFWEGDWLLIPRMDLIS